jgi:predicted permease
MLNPASDVRFAARQLIKSPGFAVTAVISLALGMGAATAIYSVVYAALLNPYPYPAVDRIVRLTVESRPGETDWVNLTGPQIRQVRRLHAIESVIAMDYHAMTLTGRDFPLNVNAIGLISTGFQDLGVPPALGRGIGPSDAPDGQDPQPVVVLSDRFWRNQFFSDPDIVGKSLQLDRKNYVIIGVAAPRFTWYMADVYLPLKLTEDPGTQCIVDLRLRSGVSQSAADSELQPLLDQFARDFPKRFPERFRVLVEGLNEWVIRGISGTLYLLFGAVALLLAIACGNVSILLLARGAARQHELAMRVAVGAGRSRIVRQLLTESALLAAIGVVLGVLMSYGILAGIRLVLPRYAFAPEVVIRINLPVLFFSGGMAVATGVSFGLWPALQLSRTDLSRMLQSGARRVAGSVRSRRTHAALIAGQIALTLLLLAGAGSAMTGFVRLLRTPLGYDPHNVLSLGIPLRENSYPIWAGRAAYFEQLRAMVAEAPGVTMAAISSNATPPRNGWFTRFDLLGAPSLAEQKASINFVSPGYFAILRIRLLQGRIWSETENARGAFVAVVNRALANRYFPNGNVIGRSLRVSGLEDRPPAALSAPNVAETWMQIVGVVDDVKNDGLANPVTPALYIPYTLNMRMGTQILVRAEVPPLTLLRALRLQLTKVNPDQQAATTVEDLDTWISNEPEWQQERLSAWVFGLFAALALILAAVGLYSVVSYTVAQRTGEFGIRMALGASRGHVLRIVFASTVVSVGGGVVAGLALSPLVNRIIDQWAKGNSRDPMILLAGTLLLSFVSVIACAVPAWRASAVDPMTSLRCE